MRRTLTVLVASAALLVPATAASAAPPTGLTNASCNSGQQRGPVSMFAQDGTGYNQAGNTEVALKGTGCSAPAGASTVVEEPVTNPDLDLG